MGTGRGGAGGIGPGGPASLQYSIPGILHFLQHEWSRFEMERGQWEVEKAELQVIFPPNLFFPQNIILMSLKARIAFLQGERKGQENLKNDLVRRIKMLEYALKQERAKYAKLKYGGDSNAAMAAVGALEVAKPPGAEEEVEMPPLEGDFIPVSNVNWRQGRHLLRQ